MGKQPNQTDVIVGARMRLRRKELGLSQGSLAKSLGITFQQVQKYEKGTNRVGASRLLSMSEALSVDIGYFFPGTHDRILVAGNSADPLNLLNAPGAVDLLRDFVQIEDRQAQKALALLARTLARALRA